MAFPLMIAPAMGAFGSFVAMEAKNELQKNAPSILQAVGSVAKKSFDEFLRYHPNTRKMLGDWGVYHSRTMSTPHHRRHKKLHM